MTKCNFAGDEKAGASWTDKIMANKAEAVSAQAGGEGEGAGEDEWVRQTSSDLTNSNLHMLGVRHLLQCMLFQFIALSK